MKKMNRKQIDKRVFAKSRKNQLHNPEWENVKKELEIMKRMRQLDHQNVVKLYEIIDDPEDDRLYLIMEYCNGGDLKHLAAKGRPSKQKFRHIFTQLLIGLDYLHNELRVAHCDLKPENILIQNIYTDGEEVEVLKIADFGVARHFGNDERSFLDRTDGTIAYTSPEAIDGSVDFHAWPLDIWSAAVCGIEYLTGECPFAHIDDSYYDVKKKIQSGEPKYPEDLEPGLLELFQGMLKKAPKERLTIGEIKLDNWILEGPGWEDSNLPEEIKPNMDLLEFYDMDFMKAATATSEIIKQVNSRVKKLSHKTRIKKRKFKIQQHRMERKRTRAYTEHQNLPKQTTAHLRSATDGDLGQAIETPKVGGKEKQSQRRYFRKDTAEPVKTSDD